MFWTCIYLQFGHKKQPQMNLMHSSSLELSTNGTFDCYFFRDPWTSVSEYMNYAKLHVGLSQIPFNGTLDLKRKGCLYIYMSDWIKRKIQKHNSLYTGVGGSGTLNKMYLRFRTCRGGSCRKIIRSKQEFFNPRRSLTADDIISWKWQHGPLLWVHKRGEIRCSRNEWAFPAQHDAPTGCQSQNQCKVKSSAGKTNKDPTKQGQQWSVILTCDIYSWVHDVAHITY